MEFFIFKQNCIYNLVDFIIFSELGEITQQKNVQALSLNGLNKILTKYYFIQG